MKKSFDERFNDIMLKLSLMGFALSIAWCLIGGYTVWSLAAMVFLATEGRVCPHCKSEKHIARIGQP